MNEGLANASAEELKKALEIRSNRDTALQAELAKANVELKGKAFYWSTAHSNWVSFWARRYRSFEIVADRPAFKADTVTASWRAKPQPEANVSRTRDNYPQTFSSCMELQLYCLGQITDEVFERMWLYPLQMSKAFITNFSEGLERMQREPPSQIERLPDDESGIKLDVPYMQLDAGEIHMLPRAFQLPGDRYLLSPISVALGLCYLEQEDRNLHRGSDLFQECDMRYVHMQEERIAKLRKMLGVT
jgi:hypothetical protein